MNLKWVYTCEDHLLTAKFVYHGEKLTSTHRISEYTIMRCAGSDKKNHDWPFLYFTIIYWKSYAILVFYSTDLNKEVTA